MFIIIVLTCYPNANMKTNVVLSAILKIQFTTWVAYGRQHHLVEATHLQSAFLGSPCPSLTCERTCNWAQIHTALKHKNILLIIKEWSLNEFTFHHTSCCPTCLKELSAGFLSLFITQNGCSIWKRKDVILPTALSIHWGCTLFYSILF